MPNVYAIVLRLCYALSYVYAMLMLLSCLCCDENNKKGKKKMKKMPKKNIVVAMAHMPEAT